MYRPMIARPGAGPAVLRPAAVGGPPPGLDPDRLRPAVGDAAGRRRIRRGDAGGHAARLPAPQSPGSPC